MIGCSAGTSSSAARASESASGTTRVDSSAVGTAGSWFGASSTSIGSTTSTGPRGGVIAILRARRSTLRTELGSTTRVAHLVTGRAMPIRSAAICASIAS
jgi:hypothetical protein